MGEFAHLLEQWGPWALGWVLAAWLLWRDYQRQRDGETRRDREVEARMAQAQALNGLAETVRHLAETMEASPPANRRS